MERMTNMAAGFWIETILVTLPQLGEQCDSPDEVVEKATYIADLLLARFLARGFQIVKTDPEVVCKD